MPFPPRRAIEVLLALWFAVPCFAQEVFINEIHYDNASGDVGEFVEIAGPAGANLSGYSLTFYNGASGQAYDSVNLSGNLPNQAGGFGALAFFVAGIQNGTPDGVALLQGGTVIEFLSYEGAFLAGGSTSTDIGVAETSGTPIGESLQRIGEGAAGADFNWVGPLLDSPGALNTGQSFLDAVPAIRLEVEPERFSESDGASAAVATLVLDPAPAGPVNISLGADVSGEIALPTSVEVGISGEATFLIGALTDDTGDGDQSVTIIATDPDGTYTAGTASVTVFDVDPAPGRGVALRVAAYNIQNGVGSPGDPAYEAALRVLRRVDADVISFTEAKPDNDFAALKMLLGDLGMEFDPTHLATVGDAFVGQTYSSGDFGSGQAIAVASRFPITSADQIGRADVGMKEMTRFPLFVRVDVPQVELDPVFVAVHLKAGSTHADIFRRAVEAYRIRTYLESFGVSGTADNLFVLGDINEDFEDFLPGSVFTGIDTSTHVFSDGSTLPGSYLLGSDIAPPGGIVLAYAQFPAPAFAPLGVRIIDASQADGAVRTYNVIGDARLDYLMVGDLTAANAAPQAEVYNSLLEYGYDGLPKLGSIPFGSDSLMGSDHHLVFGDFALGPVPQIEVTVSPSAIDEAAPVSLHGSVEIVPPAAGDLDVALLSTSGHFRLPGVVTVPAAGAGKFQMLLDRPGSAMPDGDFRVTGIAEGHMSGHDFVSVRGRQATGVLLFSQYVEPPSGGEPKAVELVNNCGIELDFADTPMRLLVGQNGAAPGAEELVLREGRLAPGAVLVVGGAMAGDYLVAEGLLGDPGVVFGDAEDGTPFLDDSGGVVFVKRTLFFNGDDALAVQLNFTLSDTFGTIGSDPGAVWSGDGVATANQNLALRDDVATGSAGWSDPGERWVTVADGSSLAGFGLPPSLSDPYAVWAASHGLLGASAAPGEDLEWDGISNLIEFAMGGDPKRGDVRLRPIVSIAEVGAVSYLAVGMRRLTSPGRVHYLLERSPDGETWTAAQTVEFGSPVPDGHGYERVSIRTADPIRANARVFLRVRVRMP